MNQDESLKLVIILGATILIGVVLVLALSEQTNNATSLSTYYTESVNLDSFIQNNAYNSTNILYANRILSHPASSGWKNDYSECAIRTIILKNSSNSVISTADYTWSTDGSGSIGWLKINDTLVY